MFITVLPYKLDPSVIIILPLNIIYQCTSSFALQILIFAYLPSFAINLWRGLKATSSLSQMDLKWYPLYFLFHMHLSGLTRWGFLGWIFCNEGMRSLLAPHCCPSLFSSPFCCVPWLICSSCGRVCLRGLRSSSDDFLAEVAPYADLLYSDLESSLSIIE